MFIYFFLTNLNLIQKRCVNLSKSINHLVNGKWKLFCLFVDWWLVRFFFSFLFLIHRSMMMMMIIMIHVRPKTEQPTTTTTDAYITDHMESSCHNDHRFRIKRNFVFQDWIMLCVWEDIYNMTNYLLWRLFCLVIIALFLAWVQQNKINHNRQGKKGL